MVLQQFSGCLFPLGYPHLMQTAALIITLVGLIASLCGAVWLQWGIKPDDQRFTEDGMLYPGRQASRVLPKYIKAQQSPTLLVVVGGGIQILGGVFAVISHFTGG